jgi:hypothetical protein
MTKSILCIEGNWDKGLKNQRSIKKALEYLKEVSKINTNYQTATTETQFFDHIQEASLKRNSNFEIIYIACHGGKGSVQFSHKNEITLEQISSECENKLSGKLLHFGCCSTLRVSPKRIFNFIEATGAKGLAGYSKDIDFHESTFLDMLLFDKYQNIDSLTVLDRQMNKLYDGFIKKLGFKLYVNTNRR